MTPRSFMGLVVAKSGCGVDIGTSVPRASKFSSSGEPAGFAAPMAASTVTGGGVDGYISGTSAGLGAGAGAAPAWSLAPQLKQNL